MKTVKVFWWRKIDNFGDLLNPYLVEKLGKCKVQYYSIVPKYQALKNIVKSIILFKKINPDAIDSFRSFGENLLIIGSVLGRANRKTLVWGAGFMSETETCVAKKILAVRGKETARKVKELGFKGIPVLGDPALLLPIIYERKKNSIYKIGIIPHWTEYEEFNEKYSGQYKVINLISKDIEGVIDEITSCEYILSSSLHGVIVGHAYNIPSIWVQEGFIHEDASFKFNDYFSSVNIPYYKGYKIDEVLSSNDIEGFFVANKEISLINNDLTEIQSQLLHSIPFPLKEKYRHVFSKVS
ncbi:polysaccharide pyruvyl transferase family protein [Siphonobacter sp. SORGH_AS_1065]|uniref:polysaccharide pyruvyl transferase family protein n=1 Tax=Siphonobacter sp. SORGH_AS_1065 TaxID=3041795 RepID=UPI00278A831F|nr:polysaccharide pyruvyl transferase family protein [Siphonobacter sp. SORGH_AS_1065]MDQ1086639.1 pyruvyl transferase [Siphonobacter sp. SORGH_AS_1065]